MPLSPDIAGSSPRCKHIEEILNEASALQNPGLPENRSALQFLGQILHALKSSKGSLSFLKSRLLILSSKLTIQLYYDFYCVLLCLMC